MPARDRRSAVWPLLAVVAGVALTVALGNWQLDRAAQKGALKARIEAMAGQPPINVSGAELEAKDVELRRVEARGAFDPRHSVFVDNRIRRGVPGFHVITPLRLEGSDRHVLVNRGWVAWKPERSRIPEVKTPEGVVVVRGMATIPGQRILELSGEVIEGRIWQNLTIERYRKAVPIGIQPFVIRQDSEMDDGLVREWEAPDFGIDRHYGYAFQWFALAATILVFYAVTRYRRLRKDGP
ncbi:MAG TPA: SURF1 family protein [Burkholderiales bacterium]|nr:SURF1 family protein [Burkholderiales bacterium]